MGAGGKIEAGAMGRFPPFTVPRRTTLRGESGITSCRWGERAQVKVVGVLAWTGTGGTTRPGTVFPVIEAQPPESRGDHTGSGLLLGGRPPGAAGVGVRQLPRTGGPGAGGWRISRVGQNTERKKLELRTRSRVPGPTFFPVFGRAFLIAARRCFRWGAASRGWRFEGPVWGVNLDPRRFPEVPSERMGRIRARWTIRAGPARRGPSGGRSPGT